MSGTGNGIRERGFGNLEIFLSEEKLASKDIAESPTRSGTPKRKSPRLRVTELPSRDVTPMASFEILRC